MVGRRSKSKIADTEECLRFAAFTTTQGGDREGMMMGLSVLWPSWVLPVMICVVPKSSSPLTESPSSPTYPRLPLVLLFFLPFNIGFLRCLGSVFFVSVVGVVFAERCSSKQKMTASPKWIVVYLRNNMPCDDNVKKIIYSNANNRKSTGVLRFTDKIY